MDKIAIHRRAAFVQLLDAGIPADDVAGVLNSVEIASTYDGHPYYFTDKLTAATRKWQTERDAKLSAIAADLELCDLGEALTTGKLKSTYKQHRQACQAEINRISPLDPSISTMTDDELLHALST